MSEEAPMRADSNDSKEKVYYCPSTRERREAYELHQVCKSTGTTKRAVYECRCPACQTARPQNKRIKRPREGFVAMVKCPRCEELVGDAHLSRHVKFCK